MEIKKGDTVEVVAGDDKGVRGSVNRIVAGRDRPRGRPAKGQGTLARDPNRDRVLVSGVNLVKKHQKPTGDVRTQAGIIEREAPIHISNVALVCPHCQQRTRVAHQSLENGKQVRVCKRCGQTID